MLRKNSTSFLVFLALRNKIRARRSAVARGCLAPLGVFARPSGSRPPGRAPGASMAHSLSSCFGALYRAVSTPGWTSFLTILISAQILFFSAFWLQTLPGRDPMSFLAPNFFGEMLTDDSFLADAPDWTAVRCLDGSIGRLGACPTSMANGGGLRAEGAAPESQNASGGGRAGGFAEIVGDARATLGHSLLLLRGHALPTHLSVVEAQAARDLARQMSARRAQIFAFPLTKLAFWFSVCCAGGVVICMSLLAVGARAARALIHLLKKPKAPIQAFNAFLSGTQGGFVFSLFSIVAQLFAFALLLGFGLGQLSALAINANLPVPVLAVSSASSSAILFPSLLANTKQTITLGKDPRSAMQRPFGAPADAIKLVGVDNPEHPPKGARLGQWSIHEIAFENTGLLLSQRAPNLTAEQRRDALWLMKCLRKLIRGGGAEGFAQVSVMGLFTAIVLTGLVGAGVFCSSIFRKAKNKAANTLQALAVEGSQLSLAQHEQKELSSVLEKTSGSTPTRSAKRL